MDSITCCMVITTAPDREVAEKLAGGILVHHLAACIQMTGISSFYRWDGAVRNDEEILLLIKTTDALYSTLETWITENHPYKVPEIIRVPIAGGLPAYVKWLVESVKV